MLEEAGKALLQGGILGAVLLLVGLYLLWLQREYRKDVALLQVQLKDSQEKRVADAQAVVTTVLTVVREYNTTMQALNATILQNTNALEELREDLRRGNN